MVLSKPPKPNDRVLKRARTEVTSKPLLNIDLRSNDIFPRFLIMQSLDKETPVSGKSVFLVAKFLESVAGKNYKAKKLTFGDVLIEVSHKEQANKLLQQTNIDGLEITITPHRTLNCSQGVISKLDLINETETDILEGLRDQGVTAVRRITIRQDSKEIKTKHVILTFDRTPLLEILTAGYLRCPTRPYVPNPRRCYKCQRYGHGTNSCRGRPKCAKCGQPDHLTDNCDASNFTCPNCHGPHAAYSRSCETFKQEKQIITLKVNENISFPEARKRFAFFNSGRYADAARLGTERRLVSAATQYSSADLLPPPRPTRLHVAAAPVTTPLAGPALVEVATHADGSVVTLVPASQVSRTPESPVEMDMEETTPCPNLAPPPALPVAHTTPSAVVVEQKNALKGATSRSREPSLAGTPRTSGDEMDVGPYLPATQRKERPSTSKPTDRPKKPLPRVQAPRDNT